MKIYLVLCFTMKYVKTRRICSSISLGCFNLANSKRIMRGNQYTIAGAQNIPISPITISENDAMRFSLYRHIHAPHSISGWLSGADSKAAHVEGQAVLVLPGMLTLFDRKFAIIHELNTPWTSSLRWRKAIAIASLIAMFDAKLAQDWWPYRLHHER